MAFIFPSIGDHPDDLFSGNVDLREKDSRNLQFFYPSTESPFNLNVSSGNATESLIGIGLETDPEPPLMPYNSALHVTENNYLEIAANRVVQREQELGRKLSTGEQTAIVDAYRQLSGVRPFFYNVSDKGYAIPKDFYKLVEEKRGRSTVGDQIIDNFNRSVNSVGNVVQNVADDIPTPGQFLSAYSLGAVAVGLVALVILLR